MNTQTQKRLDMDKIAKKLGADRRGKVGAHSGYFGAMQIAADVGARFRVPAGGGRATDPRWTERRLLPLAGYTDTIWRMATLGRLVVRGASARNATGKSAHPTSLQRRT